MSARTRTGLVILALGLVFYLSRRHHPVTIEAFPAAAAEPTAKAPRPKTETPLLKPANETKALARTGQEEIYCRLIGAKTGLPFGGKLKLWTQAYESDEDGEAGVTAFIYSRECPDGHFSKLRINASGRVKESVDCRSASREEILAQSGIQGNIVDAPSSEKKLNLAISGEGYFVADCDGKIILTRSGDFFNWEGSQVRYGGCRVLATDGGDFAWSGGAIDEGGCSSEGSCLALVRPDPKRVNFVDRITFLAESDPLLWPHATGRIFSGALESLDDPQTGPSGPYWENLEEFRPPECAN